MAGQSRAKKTLVVQSNILDRYPAYLTTGIIAENMYYYLERENILPEEQRGGHRGSRGTKDQLLIDKAIGSCNVIKSCIRSDHVTSVSQSC